jgi:hypothetical protein
MSASGQKAEDARTSHEKIITFYDSRDFIRCQRFHYALIHDCFSGRVSRCARVSEKRALKLAPMWV